MAKAAISASTRPGPVPDFYVARVEKMPLGEPEIAIGHESRIEPWFTQKHRLAFRSSNPKALAPSTGTLREWITSQTSPGKRNYSGLDLEKESRPPLEAELFFLTSLFIDH